MFYDLCCYPGNGDTVYRSWKIVCNNGRWTGVSLGCDENGQPLLEEEESATPTFNASCSYQPDPADNVVAFHGDRQLPSRYEQNQVAER